MLHGTVRPSSKSKSDNQNADSANLNRVHFFILLGHHDKEFSYGYCVCTGAFRVRDRRPALGEHSAFLPGCHLDSARHLVPRNASVAIGHCGFAGVCHCEQLHLDQTIPHPDQHRLHIGSEFVQKPAHLMGGKWVTVVHHSEVDNIENAYVTANHEIILREGTDMGSSRFLTTIVGDIYDCPCNINSCSGR
jgi:hypothetical protein